MTDQASQREITNLHVDAAAALLRAAKDMGSPADAAIIVACAAVYLEGITKATPQQVMGVLAEAYAGLRSNQEMTQVVARMISDQLRQGELWTPGKPN